MEVNSKIKKIIHILSNNSKTTTKEISKEIKTTQQNVSYLITKLEEKKIIQSYKILIDSSKFGFNNFCVFLKLKKYSKSELNVFISSLKRYEEVCCIDTLFGNYDLFLKFIVPNPSHFNKILNQILIENEEKIFDYKILTQVVLYSFPHNFLSKKQYEKKIIISGDREYISTNEIEKKILNYLNDGTKVNFAKMAQKLNTTSKTIISKIKTLENKKIIKGYSINTNHKNLNLERYYLFLKFHIKELQEDSKFQKFIENSPNIIEFLKIFGEWDRILIIEVNNSEEFKKILFKLKEEFSESIKDYDFLESEEIKLWKYLPKLEI